jgi:ubiquinone/menaquinone biosynthesis C-methylase UbiE
MNEQLPKILDLGCGKAKFAGAIGIDSNSNSDADIIHDLNKFPYPLLDNEFNIIKCIDILEHLEDVIKVIEEIWRIGKPGGEVIINVPFFSSPETHTDPTHKRGFAYRSFDYFIKDKPFFSKYNLSKATFRLREWEYDHEQKTNRSYLYRIMHKFAMKYPGFYEARLAYIFPFQSIWFKLEIIKL